MFSGAFDTTRSILAVTGDDRVAFLQGLVTNDVTKASIATPLYAAMLTPQGRFSADLFIIPTGDTILLDCPTDRILQLLKQLNFYKLRSEVKIEDISDQLEVMVFWGGNIKDSLTHLGSLYEDPRCKKLGYRCVVKKPSDLQGFQLSQWEDYNAHRLSLGIPLAGQDMIYEKAIPLECGLDDLNAIDFEKGCYLGQELTARTKHQGLVRKRLFLLSTEGEVLESGEPITYGGKKVGNMRSVQGRSGIGMVRLEYVTKIENGEGQLKVDTKTGTSDVLVHKPSWMIIE